MLTKKPEILRKKKLESQAPLREYTERAFTTNTQRHVPTILHRVSEKFYKVV